MLLNNTKKLTMDLSSDMSESEMHCAKRTNRTQKLHHDYGRGKSAQIENTSGAKSWRWWENVNTRAY